MDPLVRQLSTRDYNRRTFLRQVGLVLGAGAATGTGVKLWRDGRVEAITTPLPAGSPIVVMIELGGGNDILNTHIPYAHPTAAAYYRSARPQLGITSAVTTRPYVLATNLNNYLPPGFDLDGQFALHGALVWLANRWWTHGDVAIVEGTGENVRKDMSHFASMSYRWAGAFTGPNLATGWLGRYNDLAHPGATLGGISLYGLHQSLAGLNSPAVSIQSIPTFNWSVGNLPSGDRWKTDFKAMGDRTVPATYNKVATAAKAIADANSAIDQVQGIAPPTQSAGGLAGQLLTAAALIKGGIPCQTYVAQISGFDTHGGQPYYHYTQLAELDDALAMFFSEIDTSSRAADVFVMITSEFGRQITQNGSLGVDHGRGSATILVGGGVKGGNYGQLPSLAPAARDQDSMVPLVDFRSVWSTVLNRLGGDTNLTEAIIGRDESGGSFGDVGVFTTGPSTPLPPPSGGSTTTQPEGSGTSEMPTMPTSMPTSMPTTMPTTTRMEPSTTKATTTTVKPTTTTAKPTTTTIKPTTTTAKATTTTVKRTTTTVKRTTTTVKRTTTTTAKKRTGASSTTKAGGRK